MNWRQMMTMYGTSHFFSIAFVKIKSLLIRLYQNKPREKTNARDDLALETLGNLLSHTDRIKIVSRRNTSDIINQHAAVVLGQLLEFMPISFDNVVLNKSADTIENLSGRSVLVYFSCGSLCVLILSDRELIQKRRFWFLTRPEVENLTLMLLMKSTIQHVYVFRSNKLSSYVWNFEPLLKAHNPSLKLHDS